MSFEKLLEELDVLAKSQSAASEDEAAKALVDGDGNGEGKNKDAATTTEGEGGSVRKSLTVTDSEGNIVEVEDATVLLKALNVRFDETQGQIAKAFEGFVSVVKSQGAQIKSLEERLAKISNEGRGRKTVVSLVQKQPLAKSESADDKDGINADVFMAKAMSAQKAGRLTAVQISMAESCVNRGMEIPQEIVNAVLHQ